MPKEYEEELRKAYLIGSVIDKSHCTLPVKKSDHQILVGQGQNFSIFVDNSGDYCLSTKSKIRKNLFTQSKAILFWSCDMSNSFEFEYWKKGYLEKQLLVDTVLKTIKNQSCFIPVGVDLSKSTPSKQFRFCNQLARETLKKDISFERWEVCELEKARCSFNPFSNNSID